MAGYRSAVLGCGPRAYAHARAYKLITRGKLVACCDLDAERRTKFANEFGIPGYADAVDMIQKEKPDLVHVVTPPSLRVGLMTMISDQGVPACIVEKPIAYEVNDWRALVDLEARSKTKFAMGAQFRYHNDLTRCREAIRSGALGKVLFLDSSAGLNICDQGVHVLDWSMSLNEDIPVTRVFGAASGVEQMTSRHPSPNTTVAQLVFANGVYGMWNLGYTAPRVFGEREYTHCRVAAYCERGRVLFEEFGKWEIVSPQGVQGGKINNMDEWRAGNDRAQANLTEAVYTWLDDSSKPAGTNLKRALQQWNVILGLYASTVYRKPMDVPFEPGRDLFTRLGEALKG